MDIAGLDHCKVTEWQFKQDHVPSGVVTKVGECSCRYNVDIREHTMVQSMHRDYIRIENKWNIEMSLRASGLARLASYSQHGSDTTCHTPF
jgi:hypothetical protein